ncbi:hypothetical protein JOD43_002560 [Pullulanibacillus pueri]|nr:hypothetical protein [Pullulanibacillus pueri]
MATSVRSALAAHTLLYLVFNNLFGRILRFPWARPQLTLESVFGAPKWIFGRVLFPLESAYSAYAR